MLKKGRGTCSTVPRRGGATIQGGEGKVQESVRRPRQTLPCRSKKVLPTREKRFWVAGGLRKFKKKVGKIAQTGKHCYEKMGCKHHIKVGGGFRGESGTKRKEKRN